MRAPYSAAVKGAGVLPVIRASGRGWGNGRRRLVPELITDRERIEKVALAEENAFLKTLKAGTNI
ncbi:hypothetical protein ABT270_40055, partial [Streptomyces sp900105245]|uniref:hypothetical protein n=1 Tax=Streptomyces sp. 900105245 TaxID=3154379 RepID=UPI003328BE31